jgi:arginine deiminase
MTNQPSDAPVRRNEDHNPLIELLHTMHGDVRSLNQTLIEHIERDPVERAEAIRAAMTEAFPDGDPKGHREAHEAAMQIVRDRREFWKKMLFEISKYGLLGLLGWLAWVAWLAVLKGPR